MPLVVPYRPKQNIPESQKTETWVKENGDWCISQIAYPARSLEDGYYDIYNGVRNEDKWNHITSTYGIEYPAGKLKHIPLIRPLLNALVSEQQERPLPFSPRGEDTESINERMEQMSMAILNDIIVAIQDPRTLEQSISTLQKHYTTDYKTDLEISVHRAMNAFIQKHNILDDFSDQFLDSLITGREYYSVRVHRIGEDPEYKIIQPGDIFYPDNNVKWVNQCDWCVHPEEMTPTEILDKYGEKMTDEDRGKIEEYVEFFYKDATKLRAMDQMDNLLDNPYTYDESLTGFSPYKITVYTVQYKSIRKVYYRENPNKYAEEAPFIKYISEEEYKGLAPSKKKNLQTRYIQDLYETIRISDDIYVKTNPEEAKVKYAIRSMEYPSLVRLSYNGPTFNGRIKPYSLIRVTDDLQDLYDVLHYHKENLIALSGVKGTFMDVSQLPDFMGGDTEGDDENSNTSNFSENLKLWLYYKKMGAAFLDSSLLPAGRQQFNQFSTYDDTPGAGLAVILQMIQHIESVAERVIGINRQRMGDVLPRDGKATTEQAIVQSNIVTETLFNQHDMVVKEALYDIVNAMQVAYQNGYTGMYTDNNYNQIIFTLPAGIHLRSFGIFMGSSVREQRGIQELKQFSYALASRGLIEYEDVMAVLRKTSLADIDATIRANMSKRKKEIEAQQQQVAQLEMQLKVAKEQAEIQKLQAQVAELMSKVEMNNQKLQLERESLVMDNNIEMQKLRNDSQRIMLESKQIDASTARSMEVKNK